MKILISGSTGLIGGALAAGLSAGGHQILRLVRRAPAAADELQWSAERGILDLTAAEGIDAVVHLAGKNIAAGRWTARLKREIYNSRVGATRALCASLMQLRQPLKIFIAASAVGIYGNRGDQILTEESGAGSGFLARTALDWEAASAAIEQCVSRRVLLRFGMVLAREGGALKKMLPAFRLGLGGRLGNGRQYVSWIALEDALRAIQFALECAALTGAVNAVAPHPATNREFTAALGRALRRPTPFPAPAFALRLLLGEMADALLLSSTRALPQKLLHCGFEFSHPDLEPAMTAILSS